MTSNLFSKIAIISVVIAVGSCIQTAPARAANFFFSTGNPDGKIATGSRPETPGKVEIETGDDFILTAPTDIQQATFTGLLVNGATTSDITQVINEIYRTFPADSKNPPSGRVPTRNNSPSDVAFDSRDSQDGGLSYTVTSLSPSFSASNSVLNGINPLPNQNTLGEGPVTGQEVRFNVSFSKAFSLPADSYFFVPQVAVSKGEFLWLSAPKPIVAPGTPFNPDLQSWIRNDPTLAPDWLRIGTDIVGGNPAPTFNAAFSLTGTTQVPEPSALFGILLGGGAIVALKRRSRNKLADRSVITD
jgi:hypothetical protein